MKLINPRALVKKSDLESVTNPGSSTTVTLSGIDSSGNGTGKLVTKAGIPTKADAYPTPLEALAKSVASGHHANLLLIPESNSASSTPTAELMIWDYYATDSANVNVNPNETFLGNYGHKLFFNPIL